MADEDCRPQVQACAIRVARLDTNGVPLPGANNLYVADTLVSLAFSPVYTDGDEIEDKNACGVVQVNYRGQDSFKRGDVTIQLTRPDPQLVEMLTGGDVLTDSGDPSRPAGYAAPPIGPVVGNGISVELWSKRIDDGDLDPEWPYAHWAYPKIKNLRLADHSHGNASLMPQFTGQSYENINWYDGPVGDWPSESDRCYQWIPSKNLPVADCGYQTLAAS